VVLFISCHVGHIAEAGPNRYDGAMKLEINPRGNGACPLCERNKDCRIRRLMFENVEKLGEHDMEMEIVVYACPYFKEKVSP